MLKKMSESKKESENSKSKLVYFLWSFLFLLFAVLTIFIVFRDKETENKKKDLFQNFARYFYFVDNEHFRVINAEGLDCLVKWREMKLVANSKYLNLTE